MDAPVTMVHHRSELGAWELVTRPAHPALRGHVAGYRGYRERTPGPLRRREVPSAFVPLIISFGDAVRVSRPGDASSSSGRAVTSFVAGLHDRPVVLEHGGAQHGVQVMLTPLGAYTLLGVPMHELANAVVELGDMLGPASGKLAARLAETPSWDERLELLDDALAARLAAGPRGFASGRARLVAAVPDGRRGERRRPGGRAGLEPPPPGGALPRAGRPAAQGPGPRAALPAEPASARR